MIEQLKLALEGKSAVEIIRYISAQFGDQAVCSTSVGIEYQLMTHFVAYQNATASIFTLETGRLFSDTFFACNRTLVRYNLPIHTYFPTTEAVEQLISSKGPSS